MKKSQKIILISALTICLVLIIFFVKIKLADKKVKNIVNNINYIDGYLSLDNQLLNSLKDFKVKIGSKPFMSGSTSNVTGVLNNGEKIKITLYYKSWCFTIEGIKGYYFQCNKSWLSEENPITINSNDKTENNKLIKSDIIDVELLTHEYDFDSNYNFAHKYTNIELSQDIKDKIISLSKDIKTEYEEVELGFIGDIVLRFSNGTQLTMDNNDDGFAFLNNDSSKIIKIPQELKKYILTLVNK